MRTAEVFVNNILAGRLTETDDKKYVFEYDVAYSGTPVSLTMPLTQRVYHFDFFPPFFDGLLPEGPMLEGLLKQYKLDRDDYMGQLMAVGRDTVGAITIKAASA